MKFAVPITPTANTTAVASLSLVRNIVFITPFIRVRTVGEMMPVARTWPAAKTAPALTVTSTSEADTVAAAFCPKAPANDALVKASPRRVNRLANSPRPRLRRVESVPSGKWSKPAASFRVFPSKSQQNDWHPIFLGQAGDFTVEQ